jgi:hypothetical protein
MAMRVGWWLNEWFSYNIHWFGMQIAEKFVVAPTMAVIFQVLAVLDEVDYIEYHREVVRLRKDAERACRESGYQGACLIHMPKPDAGGGEEPLPALLGTAGDSPLLFTEAWLKWEAARLGADMLAMAIKKPVPAGPAHPSKPHWVPKPGQAETPEPVDFMAAVRKAAAAHLEEEKASWPKRPDGRYDFSKFTNEQLWRYEDVYFHDQYARRTAEAADLERDYQQALADENKKVLVTEVTVFATMAAAVGVAFGLAPVVGSFLGVGEGAVGVIGAGNFAESFEGMQLLKGLGAEVP